MTIPFFELPGFPNLFLDYVYEFENVKNFYSRDFRDRDSYKNTFFEIASQERNFKQLLPTILLEQYKGDSPSQKTIDNINFLGKNNCVAVLTGQQLGIFGGPLYTFYKIITAIKLARNLNERFEDFRFVPVFWLEADDHDLEEVRHISFLDESNEIIKLSYEPGVPFDEEKGSVGDLQFTEDIENFINEFGSKLRKTEFTDEVLEGLRKCYKPGETFKTAFRRLLMEIFDSYGLILFDPQDKSIKEQLRPLFRFEIENYRKNSEKVVQRSAILEEFYHAQVKVKPVNLFMNVDKGRYLLEPTDEDGEFRLRKKRLKFTFPELMEIVEKTPERFSPNVLLRPICQDYIFPTGFYIAGPAEVSYFAQVSELYKEYGITPPFIYPRISATLLEKGIQSLMEKYNLRFTDSFLQNENLGTWLIDKLSDVRFDILFENYSQKFSTLMDELKKEISVVEKTTADAAEKYKVKILSALKEYETKAIDSEKKKHEVVLRQAQKLLNNIYPQSKLQERAFNYFYFANKYGPRLIDKIYEEVDIGTLEHQIINL